MTSQIHFRMDEKEKQQLESVFHSIGLTTGDAFRIFAKKSIEVGGIPFELSSPNKRLEDAMKSQDYIEFDNAESGLDWLNDEI